MALAATHNASGPSDLTELNDLILVSDLHLADGRTPPFGKFTHGENFFWDEAFGRFVGSVCEGAAVHPQTLIINGDLFDFLRVDRIPRASDPADAALVHRWQDFLRVIDHPEAGSDLYAADRSEQEYGFKTQDYKSVWKLLLMYEGHKVFFATLDQLLRREANRLVIVKGNHDLEFLWEPVRQAFVYFVAGEDCERYASYNERVSFFQESVVINGQFYVEHGHRYEEVTHTDRDTRPENKHELDLPVGSLFNRYVINKIEEIDPLFDNIKPPTDILKAVAVHSPAKALKIVGHHLVGAWRLVTKYHVGYATRIMMNILTIGLPVVVFGILAVVLYIHLQQSITDSLGAWLLNGAGSLAGAFFVRWVQKRLFVSDKTPSLLDRAKEVLRTNPSLKMITFGHTHASEMSFAGKDCWYVNSGTWIPTIDLETHEIQDTNTFCVLRLINEGGVLRREPLLRWNDSLPGLEPMVFFGTPS